MLLKVTRVASALMLFSSVAALPLIGGTALEVFVDGESLALSIVCPTTSTLTTTTTAGTATTSQMGLAPICPGLTNKSDIAGSAAGEAGCVRYVKGFDITGVVTEVDLTMADGINDQCDCIQACLNRFTTCAAYVYKFSTPESVASGFRTCTLYSQFNLPSDVVIAVDLNNVNTTNVNAEELVANGNNPQNGALVSQTFMDMNLNTTVDPDAISGEVWALSTGHRLC